MKFSFTDGEKIGFYKDGKTEKFESSYIERYKETARRSAKNSEWKKNSDLMLYEGFVNDNNEVRAEILSVCPTFEENKILYSFAVNESFGIYWKDLEDEKKTEAHFLTSNEEIFSDLSVNNTGDILGKVQKDPYASDIVVFSKNGGDYKTLTGGDSLDENPFFTQQGIWFNSYGIGRNVNNEFVKYVPSEILRLNPVSMQIETVISDENYSFIKPVLDGEGNLYCIKKEGEEKEKKNVFLEILLIPVRIIQAIVGFISMFVTIFTGKPLVEGKGRSSYGGSAAKNPDGKKIFLHQTLLNVEKEMKKNKNTENGGFIPRSFKLVKIDLSNKENVEELTSGVADFCLVEEEGEQALFYTNGKHIFQLKIEKGEWKRRKILNTDCCLKIASLNGLKTQEKEELFFQL